MFVYLALLTFHPFIPASCGLWGLILVATSRREFTLNHCPTSVFGRKKPPGERVGKLSCLTAEKAYVTEKGAVILLCCAVLCCAVLCCAVLCCAVLCECSPIPHGCQAPFCKKSYQPMVQRFRTRTWAQRYIQIIAEPAFESNGFYGIILNEK